MARADNELAARRRKVVNALESFGLCVERVADRLRRVASKIDPGSVQPGTLHRLRSIHAHLEGAAREGRTPCMRRPNVEEDLAAAEDDAKHFGVELEALAEDFRDATLCSTTLVVPRPLEDLIDVCQDLFSVLRWWVAVRSGELDLSDGPSVRERLEVFGRRVEGIARWLDDEVDWLCRPGADPDKIEVAFQVQQALLGIAQRCRDAETVSDQEQLECSEQRQLRALAEELRAVSNPSLGVVADEMLVTHWRWVDLGARSSDSRGRPWQELLES
jgi:hypothetical protein